MCEQSFLFHSLLTLPGGLAKLRAVSRVPACPVASGSSHHGKGGDGPASRVHLLLAGEGLDGLWPALPLGFSSQARALERILGLPAEGHFSRE